VWVADESPVGEDDTETGGGEEMIMASPAWGDGQDVSLDFPRSVSQPVPHLSSFSRPTTRSTSREPTSNWCVCVRARERGRGKRENSEGCFFHSRTFAFNRRSRPRTSEGVMMGNPMGVGSVREYVGKLEQHGRRLSPDAKEMAVTAVAGDSTHAHARTSMRMLIYVHATMRQCMPEFARARANIRICAWLHERNPQTLACPCVRCRQGCRTGELA
jgi:hypothetical protein